MTRTWMGPAACLERAWEEMPPISLDEITASAQLQTRVDRKYLVPAQAAAVLTAVPGARALEIEGDREFHYYSTYFDTTELASFRSAAGRRRRRFKVRTRRYGDGDCYLEVKTRDGRGRSVKRRVPHAAADRYLTDDDLAAVGEMLAGDGVDLRGVDLLLPVLDTSYVRSTIFLPTDGARVTIDRDLTWTDPAGRALSVDGLVVIETKSAGVASTVDRALWRGGRRPQSISKYATGMTLLFPDLPGNRWHRVRRRLAPYLSTSGSVPGSVPGAVKGPVPGSLPGHG